MRTERNIAIIVAAGVGNRLGGELPKQFQAIGGKPMAVHSLELFEKSPLIDEIVFVVSDDHLVYASQAIVDHYGFKKIRKITAGGKTRQESVLAGLTACPSGINLVIIHDAARPFMTTSLLEKVILKAGEIGGAILAVPAKDSIKVGEDGIISKTLRRNTVWIAQTPQVFRFDKILEAHKRGEAARNEATDDSELYEQYIGQVALVMGSYNNIKITTPGDMILAQEIFKGSL